MDKKYSAFLESKAIKAGNRGIKNPKNLAKHLFDFQRHVVEFSLRAGASGCFLDTGMGKTEVQLEWCAKALDAAGGRALILTPLAVAAQTARRAERWGYEARVIREQSQAGPGINIINYDRLEKIDPSTFSVLSLDEASILKSFTGKTTRALIDAFEKTQFKMAATATPAPNDHMEIGNYAEFLNVMAANEMLSRFFINDTSTASQEWRLKRHAERSFWDWMASWARMGERPSDITGNTADDASYELPPFDITRHRARDEAINNDFASMFGAPALSATTLHDVKRQTISARADVVGEQVAAETNEPWIIWCDTNYEADALKAAIPSAVEVRGSDTIDRKEDVLDAFGTGKIRHLIAKPQMCGYGLDWSHVARMAFVGRSYSYETWYQAVRRCWRFGQKRNLQVHLAVAEGEGEIGRVIDRKATDHTKMRNAMRDAMRRATDKTASRRVAYVANSKTEVPSWLQSNA